MIHAMRSVQCSHADVHAKHKSSRSQLHLRSPNFPVCLETQIVSCHVSGPSILAHLRNVYKLGLGLTVRIKCLKYLKYLPSISAERVEIKQSLWQKKSKAAFSVFCNNPCQAYLQ